jgi:hypothetical protein
MDLIYKIGAFYLYDNQLNHDYLFFYNRKESRFRNELRTDADYLMFGSSEYCANSIIHSMDKSDPLFLERSIELMTETAGNIGIPMVKSTDFITLEAIHEGSVSYNSHGSGVLVEEGEYKGYYKQVYTPYNLLWNETKSGINPFEWEVAGVWNPGQSTYSTIRLWEYKEEREITIRDNKLIELGI